MAPAASAALRRAVFLDRDGVLNHDDGYTFRVDALKLLPRVPEALAELKRRGFALVVASNQSGIARGMFTRSDADRFHAAMSAAIMAAGGAAPDAYYLCPHAPDAGCPCRKPEPGMLQDAAAALGIDLPRSYMVGDRESDRECGARAGAKGILLGAKGDAADLWAALPLLV